MPRWVQIWVFVILVPVNAISIFFVNEPFGVWIAVLAIGGFAPNLFVMLYERGFSNTMALPHVVIWTPLVIWIAIMLKSGTVGGGFAAYLWVLLVVNLISLAFDFLDTRDWLKGVRRMS